MKKKVKLKKKVKKVLLVIILLIFIVSLFIYFKPIRFNDKIIDNNKVSLKLINSFGKCKIKSVIYNKSLDKIIVDDLIKDNYIKNKNTYKKEFILNKSCKSLYLKRKNNFKLKGDNPLAIEVNSEYNDEGYILKSINKVTMINNIDSKKIGVQKVVYKLSSDLYSKYLIRNVEVIDITKPIIELKGDSEITLYLNDKYEEYGYVASDNYDGDITDKVVIEGSIDTSKVGKYELVYKVMDSSENETIVKRIVNVIEKKKTNNVISYNLEEVKDLTYINGILVVNKKYGLPKDYNPGVNSEALNSLKSMQSDASVLGLNLSLLSGFRSYQTQNSIYNNYVKKYGQTLTDTFSARPGYSEHQTGLAFDVGQIKDSFGQTKSGKWLEENCHLYGFIIRYPKGKQSITGYKYEPWHIRYLGVEIATKVKNSGLTLEEYLGIN